VNISRSDSTGLNPPVQIHLTTHLSPQVCASRLQGILGGKRVIGHADERSAFLCRSGYQFEMGESVFRRNSFRPRLRIKLIGAPSGTLIVCRSGIHPLGLAFLAAWLGLLIFIGVRIAFGTTVTVHSITVVGFIATLGSVGFAFVWWSRMLARGDVAFLLDVVAEATEARPA